MKMQPVSVPNYLENRQTFGSLGSRDASTVGDFRLNLERERIRQGSQNPAERGTSSAAQRAAVEIGEFVKVWEETAKRSRRLLETVPKDTRSLIELQLTVSRLGFQSELLARAGDTLAQTVRRVQQMGSS